MKRIVFLGGAILAALLLFSCEAGEDGKLFGGEKIKTILTYSWDKAMVKDTAFLYLNQTLSYIEDGKEKKLYPQAVVKLYPRQDTVYYAAGYAPAPSFEKTDAVQGYQGIEPRKWVYLCDLRRRKSVRDQSNKQAWFLHYTAVDVFDAIKKASGEGFDL